MTLVIVVRQVQSKPPHKRRAAYLQLVFAAAAIAAVVLVLAGKMHWLGAALTGTVVAFRQSLPLLIRAFPLLSQWLQSRQRSSNSQRSEVSSALLKMTLDHESGELDGQVIDGPYKDWWLRELNRQQLDELLRYCEAHDEDSRQLLGSYLAQRFPGEDDPQTEAPSDAQDSQMGRQEALSILGVGEDASEDDIISAHRRLMQKLHPDRGGNDYLAAKINAAKDLLLQS